MRISRVATISVFDLFVHDRYECDVFDERAVAEFLQTLINASSDTHYAVYCPDDNGLSRFTLVETSHLVDERPIFIDRPKNRKDVKQALPKKLREILEEIDDEKFDSLDVGW